MRLGALTSGSGVAAPVPSDSSAAVSARRARILGRLGALGLLGLALLCGTGLGVARLASQQPWTLLLGAVRWPALLGAAVLVVAGAAAHGPRMRALLPLAPGGGPLPGRLRLGSLYLAASVLNLSFPGPAGELAAALVLRRTHRLSAAGVLAASLHGRFLSLLWAGALCLLMLPGLDLPPGLVGLCRAAAGIIALLGLGLGLLSFRPAWLRALSVGSLGRLILRLPGRIGPLEGLHRAILGFADALGALPRQGAIAYVRASAWSLLGMACTFGALLCTAAAFGLHPGLWGSFFTLCLTQIAGVALVVLPGGLGAFDLSLTGALVATAGLDGSQAALVLLGVRAAQILALLAGGGFFAFWAAELLTADGLASLERGRLLPDEGSSGA